MSAQYYCENDLDDGFVNQCRIQYPKGIWTNLASVINDFANPETLAVFVVLCILILPLLILQKRNNGFTHMSMQKFYHSRIHLLNFLHRINYSLILNLALFASFRQRSPCLCPDGGVMKRIGPYYGMPSSHGVCAGILGAYLIDSGPYWPLGARFAGTLLMVWISMERVVLGYSSFGQSVVGVMIGIILHYYSTRLPQMLVFIDAIVEVVAAFVLLRVDSNLVYAEADENNLTAALFFGLGFEIFACLLIFRHFQKTNNWNQLKRSIRAIEPTLPTTGDRNKMELSEIIGVEELVTGSIIMVSDVVYTMSAFVILIVFVFVSLCIIQYDWLA